MARLAPAREGLIARFEREVDPDGTLDPDVRAKLVESRKKRHFAELAYKKAKKAHLDKMAAEQAAGSPAATDDPACETPQDPSKEEGSR